MPDVLRASTYYIQWTVDFVAVAVVVIVVALMALRWVLLKVSPFGGASYQIRQLTDPIVWPIAQRLPFPNSADVAPLFVVLVALLGAFFFKWMAGDVLRSLSGLLGALLVGAPFQVLGWLLYGAISILSVLIIARIILSWMPFLRGGRLMWTLHSLTEPVMAPFRRLIPPLGMLDLSPILLIFLLNFSRNAVQSLFMLAQGPAGF